MRANFLDTRPLPWRSTNTPSEGGEGEITNNFGMHFTWFPGVAREQVLAVLAHAEKSLAVA